MLSTKAMERYLSLSWTVYQIENAESLTFMWGNAFLKTKRKKRGSKLITLEGSNKRPRKASKFWVSHSRCPSRCKLLKDRWCSIKWDSLLKASMYINRCQANRWCHRFHKVCIISRWAWIQDNLKAWCLVDKWWILWPREVCLKFKVWCLSNRWCTLNSKCIIRWLRQTNSKEISIPWEEQLKLLRPRVDSWCLELRPKHRWTSNKLRINKPLSTRISHTEAENKLKRVMIQILIAMKVTLTIAQMARSLQRIQQVNRISLRFGRSKARWAIERTFIKKSHKGLK